MSEPGVQNQIAMLADMDMSLMSDDWIEESFELLLNSDTTQSTETKSSASSNEFDETDKAQQVMDLADRRRLYRRRSRYERETLKRRESELTQELTQLRMAKKNKQLEITASRSAAYFFWKNIACRQLEQRTIAEAEQRRLSAAVKIQSSYITILRDIMQNRSVDMRNTALSAKTNCVKSSEASMIDAYVNDLDRNYLRTDEVFRSTESPGIGATVQSVKMHESDGGVAYFQQITKLRLPFSLHALGHSFWTLGMKHHGSKQGYIRNYDVKDPENTIVASFTDTKMLTTGIAVSLLQRLIARRFDRSNCIVEMWKTITEGKGIFDGMQMDETGWCRLQPSLDDSQPGTIVDFCIRRVPVYFKASPPRSTVDDFHSMIQEVGDYAFTGTIASIQTQLQAT